jgi:hypothetical protein
MSSRVKRREGDRIFVHCITSEYGEIYRVRGGGIEAPADIKDVLHNHWVELLEVVQDNDKVWFRV